jgi:hypothetical protein
MLLGEAETEGDGAGGDCEQVRNELDILREIRAPD